MSTARPLTKIQREKAGARRFSGGGSAAEPRGVNRRAGTDVGFEGFVLKQILISTLPLTAEVPKERSPSRLPILLGQIR